MPVLVPGMTSAAFRCGLCYLVGLCRYWSACLGKVTRGQAKMLYFPEDKGLYFSGLYNRKAELGMMPLLRLWWSKFQRDLLVPAIPLFLAVFGFLCWNESRAVKVDRSLEEAKRTVISVSPDRVDPANEGKLVHVVGMITASNTVGDLEFGVDPKALFVQRKVEMYQWDETCHQKLETRGGDTTVVSRSYSLDKIWHDEWIDSGKFHAPEAYPNPASSSFTPSTWSTTAEGITLNAFSLRPELLVRTQVVEPLVLEEVPQALSKLYTAGQAQLSKGVVYFGKDPWDPQVGDRRISYKVIKPAKVSVISMQVGNGFKPFTTSNGCELEIFDLGSRTVDEMVFWASMRNLFLTWLYRLGGLLLLPFPFFLLLHPFSERKVQFSFHEKLPETFTGPMARFPASLTALLTLGSAWIYYRPFPVRIFMPVIPVLIAFYLRNREKKEVGAVEPTAGK